MGMKTSTEKYCEKEVLWNKGVFKTLVKIHEIYLLGCLQVNLHLYCDSAFNREHEQPTFYGCAK